MTSSLPHITAARGLPERRPEVSRRAALAVWLVICVAGAWFDTRYGVKAVAGTVVVAFVALLVRFRAYGVLIGLALVGALNGFPGVDVNPGANSISHVQDAFALAIIGGSLYVVASGKVAPRTRLQRSLYVACGALAFWWMLTWARTVIFNIIPASLAARFARDFLYFAITLPLLADVFVTYPRLRRQVFWTLGLAGSIFAVAQIIRSQTSHQLNFILHSHLLTSFDGSTRVYSPMTMLVRAAFALSLGTVVVGPTSRARRRAIVPTLLFGVSMVLQLTRAAYFGAAVGFLLAAAVWWFRRSTFRDTARKQLILLPVLLAVVVGTTAAVSAGERHVISKVATRAVGGYSDVNNTSGTVAVRTQVANQMLQVLGSDWPIGLGFQHPQAHPYPTLPNGSIRDADLGVLNAVMLMGVVGAILVYLPALIVLRALTTRRRQRQQTPGDEWLRLGATIWIIGVVASSITLLELFSFGGLELSATMLALAVSAAVGRYASAGTATRLSI